MSQVWVGVGVYVMVGVKVMVGVRVGVAKPIMAVLRAAGKPGPLEVVP
jgi:hypothetical protein